MPPPRKLVVTGSSGFIGRHLLDGLKEDCRIYGLARRSQLRCGAPFSDNITWFQVDIGERDALMAAFHAIRDGGGADTVVHLAAHYDFTGEDHPEYWRTNIEGLRNVLDGCRDILKPRHFVFASSVAACRFPTAGTALTERSAPDGEHIYAVTKRLGEEMLGAYDDVLHSVIVRFAALFSDWCEYPPLYFFLNTWLSDAWNSRILGGRGMSAVPYLHVRDAVAFLARVIERLDMLEQREVVLASPDGAVNHSELFELATLSYLGGRGKPVHMPHLLCRLGVNLRDVMGRLLGERPFERPWMVRYIDKALTVDARATRERLDWVPRPRLEIRRRMPFLAENFKTDPVEWHRRNREAMKEVRLRNNLRIHRLLEKHHEEICQAFTDLLHGPEGKKRYPSYQRTTRERLHWRHRLILRHLMNSIRTQERGVFMAYCRDLAERRFAQGFRLQEVCDALEAIHHICLLVLRNDPESEGLEQAVHDYVTMSIQFGCDQIHETYERLEARPDRIPRDVEADETF